MAKAYALEGNDGTFIHASRSNDGKTVYVSTANDESKTYSTAVYDYADFMRFMSTLAKNWGK